MRALTLLAVTGLLAATAVPPAAATHTWTYTGTILAPAPGASATDAEFALRCPHVPVTNGAQGWVFALPPALHAGDVVGLTATGDHDLTAFVYTSDCAYDRTVTGPTGDLYVTLAAGDAYLSVVTATGAHVTVTLTAPVTAPALSPDDPLFYQDGDLRHGGQWNLRKVEAPRAWNVATGAGVDVAVLDTGLDLGHPDFQCAGKVTVVPGADVVGGTPSPEDQNGHGTHVAGIVGACANDGIGVAGIAPGATLMPIRVIGQNGVTAADLATGLRLATDQGAQVISMSLNFGVNLPTGPAPFGGAALGAAAWFPQIDSAVSYATSRGVVVVAAAGNESAALCGYPAYDTGVVCVGASDPNDLNARYGNLPVKVQPVAGPGLLAPGGTGTTLCDASSFDILSTYARAADTAEGDCDGLPGYASLAGTSMATPLVAGAAALVYEKLGGVRSTTNAAKVVEALTRSAKDLYTPGFDPLSGYGRLDAYAAVTYWP